MFGLMGKKKGMTQIFDGDGNIVPVTVLEVGPCMVVQKKSPEKDGYAAVQLGFQEKKASRATKPYRGHFEKKKLPIFQTLKEVRVENVSDFQEGQTFTVECFQAGDIIDVTGQSKGRGFQGVMKRHGKHGGPDSHGSDFHRGTGSIGMRAWPGRVLKNMRLPGRMGNDKVTTQKLLVVKVEKENNLMLVKGAVPGFRNADVFVFQRGKSFPKAVKETKQEDDNAAGSAEQGK